MKYKLTEKGKKLFTAAFIDITYWDLPRTIEFWRERFLHVPGMIELGLLEEAPKRIELAWNMKNDQVNKHRFIKFTESEIKTMEHAINGEYVQIPGNLEWVYELYYDYKENGENYDNFDHYLDRIKANK